MVRLQQRSIAESSQRQYKGTWEQWKSSVNTSECQSGSRSKIRKHNHYYWLPSPFIAGPEEINTAEPRPVPFNLKCATFAGIIGHLPDSNLNYDRTTPSQLLECDEQAQQRGDEVPSRGKYSNGSCATLTSNNPAPRFRRGLRYWAFFLLRSAEYLAVKGRRRIYTLQVRDVILQDELGLQTSSLHTAVSVEITLRGQKNDQQDHGTKRVLSRSGHRALCPVLAGRLLMENARNLQLRPEDPISSIKASTMLPAKTMSKVLHAAAKATGEDAMLCSFNSLRRGGATALLSAGVDSTAVMHGRWKSDSYQRYTSYTIELGRQLAAQMAFGGSSTVQQAVPRQ
ncbi:hypothetical protein PPTG_20661 [Phytophthora nicotianae INRA-310]|uniref:Tyr recombinase domain-containing protein n=1 Tax=Phytophthora nicotianae (strain INRA-310) TaxID=761204 RepID=W2RG59_PHYN3|nr:hypothetical protein PPTG_20661 [Phytophthora nicotianae INRA-310]ETN23535.1 hypothetical protein PPTG_20661 [Phytophthora nicotianae INRA-310]